MKPLKLVRVTEMSDIAHVLFWAKSSLTFKMSMWRVKIHRCLIVYVIFCFDWVKLPIVQLVSNSLFLLFSLGIGCYCEVSAVIITAKVMTCLIDERRYRLYRQVDTLVCRRSRKMSRSKINKKGGKEVRSWKISKLISW